MSSSLKKFVLNSLCVLLTMFFTFANYSQEINAQILQTTPIAVSAGSSYTAVIKNDGTVWTWGLNDNGQLGDGTNTNSITPIKAKGLNDIISICTGVSHTVALKHDGTVWTWGDNSYGQLGIGTNTNVNIPTQVTGLNNIVAISAGTSTTAAIKNDGTVWFWGNNAKGQFGNGTNTNSNIPIQIPGLNGIKSISIGENHSVALKDDNTVWTWGDNSFGQLGYGSNESTNIPLQVITLDDIKAISTGDKHTVALKNDGTVWTWGDDLFINLGGSALSLKNTSSPAMIVGLNNITSIATAAYYTIALKNDGTVWSMGLGITSSDSTTGQPVDLFTPIQVSGLNNVISIESGFFNTFVTKNDGSVWSWGRNQYGELGNSNSAKYTVTPSEVTVFIDNQQFIDLDKGSLAINYINGENSTNVTQNIILPTSGPNGTTISWISSNPSIVSNTGTVTRPAFTTGNLDVTLTATLTKGSSNGTKLFKLTVLKTPISDIESINIDKASIMIGYKDGDNSTSITQDITLPTTGSNGTSIKWNSSNPSVVSDTGVVNRPNSKSSDSDITLSAVITKGSITETITFPIRVKSIEPQISEGVIQTTTEKTIFNETLPNTGTVIDFSILSFIGFIFVISATIILTNKKFYQK